jgi:hypothetical protein
LILLRACMGRLRSFTRRLSCLIISLVLVFMHSLWVTFTNSNRSPRLAGRYGSFEKRVYNPGKFANQVFIGCICYVRTICIRSGLGKVQILIDRLCCVALTTQNSCPNK